MTHSDDRYLLIGLTGRSGAGKDTAADVLCEAYQFYRIAFADPLRVEIATAFSVDLSIFSLDTKTRPVPALAIDRCADIDFRIACSKLGVSFIAPRSPREIMQWWGTEYRRRQNPYYWTRKASDTIHDAMRSGFRRIVVTDVRFRNEAELIHYHNGRLWEIRRATVDGEPVSHPSEAGVGQIEIDHVIDNNGSMPAFAQAVMQAYQDTP